MASGCVTILVQARTTCTRSSASSRARTLSRRCTRIWLPDTVLVSGRFTYVFHADLTPTRELTRRMGRFFASSSSKSRMTFVVPTSSSSLFPNSNSLSHTVSGRQNQPLSHTAPARSDGRVPGSGCLFGSRPANYYKLCIPCAIHADMHLCGYPWMYGIIQKTRPM